MPECIVCKGYYERNSGAVCPRCGSDNQPWLMWQKSKPVEQDDTRGFAFFLEPHFYLPLLITGWVFVFGPLWALTLWSDVQPLMRILAVVVAPLGCLLASWGVYDKRLAIREAGLLVEVRRGWRKLLGPQAQTVLAPALALALTLILTWLLVISDPLWEMTQWLALEEPAGVSPESGLRERVLEVSPFASLIGFVLSSIAFTYSFSLMMAWRYMKCLSKTIPHPIFLQEGLLVKVVQHEAGRAVHREDPAPRVIGGAKATTGARPESRSWIWDEMERTNDGGIRLKAIVEAGSKMEESLIGERTERPVHVTYVVEADPWSRITKVVHIKETEEKK